MISRKLFIPALFFAVSVFALVSSCKKDTTSQPLEPISLVKPDSGIVRVFAGDKQDIEIKFTTDRPINWLKGMYDIDSLDLAGYIPTYPDTLFAIRLDTVMPRVNLYTYTGSYTVPDTLRVFSNVRFRVSFEAGKSTFTTGQNYPAGIKTFSKDFRIDVR